VSYLAKGNLFLDVQQDLVPDHAAVLKFGSNQDIDQTQQDIWTPGGTLSYRTSAATATVVSDEANDDDGDTGARTIRIEGLDSSYDVITEDITMNGTTGVTTANSYLRIYRMHVLTAGSSGVNEGIITATSTTVQAEIPANHGQTLMAIYTVPAGYSAYLFQYYFSIQKNKQISADFRLFVRPFGGAWNLKSVIGGASVGSSYGVRVFTMPLKITEKSDIKMTAAGSGNSGQVCGGFDLINVVN